MVSIIGVHLPDCFHLDKIILVGGTGRALASYYQSFMHEIDIPVTP